MGHGSTIGVLVVDADVARRWLLMQRCWCTSYDSREDVYSIAGSASIFCPKRNSSKISYLKRMIPLTDQPSQKPPTHPPAHLPTHPPIFNTHPPASQTENLPTIVGRDARHGCVDAFIFQSLFMVPESVSKNPDIRADK